MDLKDCDLIEIGFTKGQRMKIVKIIQSIKVGQSLSQRSKARTNVADPGSASGGTFQCMQFLPFFLTCSIYAIFHF